MFRDPFGWDGPEIERPWIWGELGEARRAWEYQEIVIGRYVQIVPETLAPKFPHYPPTDRTRAKGHLFERWEREQEYRQQIARDADQKDELDALAASWTVDGKVVDCAPTREWEERVWVWHDAATGVDVACGYGGERARMGRVGARG